jgi:anti-sigma B factor antagonist
MNLEIIEHNHITVAKLVDSRLDAAKAVQFKDAFRNLSDAGAEHVILDMSDVNFMDSSGLGAVVAVLKLMGRNKRFEIAGLTPAVEKVFKLTRMDSVFRIYGSVEEALPDPIAKAV